MGKTLDIVSSSIFHMCDVDRTWNNIFKIHWFHWFPSPDLQFSQNGLDTKKIFFIPKEGFCFYHSRVSSEYEFRYRIEEVIYPPGNKITGVVFIILLEQILIDQQYQMYSAPLANQVP